MSSRISSFVFTALAKLSINTSNPRQASNRPTAKYLVYLLSGMLVTSFNSTATSVNNFALSLCFFGMLFSIPYDLHRIRSAFLHLFLNPKLIFRSLTIVLLTNSTNLAFAGYRLLYSFGIVSTPPVGPQINVCLFHICWLAKVSFHMLASDKCEYHFLPLFFL